MRPQVEGPSRLALILNLGVNIPLPKALALLLVMATIALMEKKKPLLKQHLALTILKTLMLF
jgi:hypothetical protein